MRIRLRQLWLTIHRWLGLTIGLLFVLLGLTGSALVFDHAIDEWLNPELLLAKGEGDPIPLSEVVLAAQRAVTGEFAHAHAASAPRIPGGVWTVWFQGGSEQEPVWTQVYVDPYSGEVTGRRVWGEYFMSVVYKLHYTLLGGRAGEVLVGLGGLLLMCSIASGVYLWWPLWRSGWRSAFAIRGQSRFTYDLHKTLGILSAVPLLVVAFTGVYMIFPEWIKPLVTLVSSETLPPDELRSGASAGRALTPDEAVAIARQHYPEARLCHFHPPADSDGAYEVTVRQPGEIQRSFGRTQLWIDRYTGEILAVRDPDRATVADRFLASQFPLHNGEAFGLAGRWCVFALGFLPAVLYVTGVLLWWRRSASRRRQRRKLRLVDSLIPNESARVDQRRPVGMAEREQVTY